MTIQEEWQEFLTNLYLEAIKKYNETLEGKHLKERNFQIDDDLSSRLTEEQKSFVDNILFELATTEGKKVENLYHQGLKDCVWILKNMGVLA